MRWIARPVMFSAAIRVSAPLFPGPASKIRVAPSGVALIAARATAMPAAAITDSSEIPLAHVRSSQSRIWATEITGSGIT